VQALLPVTRRFQFLEEGEVADVRLDRVTLFDRTGKVVKRKVHESTQSADAVDRGEYAHYMLKEIYEQPRAIADTLSERIADGHVLEAIFGPRAGEILPLVKRARTSSRLRHELPRRPHRPLLLRARAPTSRARWKSPASIVTAAGGAAGHACSSRSRSRGETADTLAALHEAKKLGYVATLAICNVPESSAVRAADLTLMTRAGPEVGVASTKAFTTQLAALGLLGLALARHHAMPKGLAANYVRQAQAHPGDDRAHAEARAEDQEVGEAFRQQGARAVPGPRGELAGGDGRRAEAEGDLLHPRRGVSAGELKHGPLALVDANMPVVAVAPNNALLEKLKSNLQEVRARGGRLYVFATRWRASPRLKASK